MDPGWGVNPGGRVSTYDFAKFSKKLHATEEMLGHRGKSQEHPPLDLPLGSQPFANIQKETEGNWQ